MPVIPLKSYSQFMRCRGEELIDPTYNCQSPDGIGPGQ